VVSRQELDQAQSAYDAAKADVEASAATVRQQQVQLHYFLVKAPAAGIVGDIPVRLGDRVTNSTLLTTIDTGRELEAYIYIAAEKASDVRLGTPVDLLDENGKPRLRVKVSFISPRVDPDTQLLLITAIPTAKQADFRNQEVVHSRVIWDEKPYPVVPLTAVSRMGGSAFVFVIDQKDGKSVARQRSVQLGQLVGNDYPVLEGLKSGEKIIVSGVQMLVDGMPVAPIG
jgi:RND family efflux transporter MFP subunit